MKCGRKYGGFALLATVVAGCAGASGTTGIASSSGAAGPTAASVAASSGAPAAGTTGTTAGVAGGTSTGQSGTSGAATTSATTTSASSSSGATTGGGNRPCSGHQGSLCTRVGGGAGACCAGVCEDLETDPANCGGCGAACAAPATQCVGQQCLVAACTPAAAGWACPVGDGGLGSCCGSGCAVVASDPANCGSCGAVCPTGAACAQSACSLDCADAGCPGGLGCAATASGDACEPIACTGQNQVCTLQDAGAPGSGGSGSCCGTSCVNLATDPANCGVCGAGCGPSQLCNSGVCIANSNCASAPASATCGLPGGGLGYCCGGACAALDLASDGLNCGGCGLACPVAASCADGTCVLGLPDSGELASCAVPDQSCPPGYACAGAACATAACNASTTLNPCALDGGAGAGVCCGALCTGLDTDQNCGACGAVCGTGTFCLVGACTPIPACALDNDDAACPLDAGGTGECCGGTCLDVGAALADCGGCGVACAPGGVCSDGTCQAGGGMSQELCELGPDGGCPEDTDCVGNTTCLAIDCPIGESGQACSPGPGLQGTCCDGLCSALTQDPANCGACGNVCESGICADVGLFACYLADAGPQTACAVGDGGCPSGAFCIGSLCVPASCLAGAGSSCTPDGTTLGICCKGFRTETCADLNQDPANCGACGLACPAEQSCGSGACSGDLAPCGVGSQGLFCALDGGELGMCCVGSGCIGLEDTCGG